MQKLEFREQCLAWNVGRIEEGENELNACSCEKCHRGILKGVRNISGTVENRKFIVRGT